MFAAAFSLYSQINTATGSLKLLATWHTIAGRRPRWMEKWLNFRCITVLTRTLSFMKSITKCNYTSFVYFNIIIQISNGKNISSLLGASVPYGM